MRIFIAIAQYSQMTDEQEINIAQSLGFKNWKPTGYHPMFALSLNGLSKYTSHEYGVYTLRGDAIDRARCHLFGRWLKEWNDGNKFDYFWQLDEDVSFHHSAVQKMIDSDKPIVGGTYAFKVDTGPKVGRIVCRTLPGEKGINGLARIRWLNGGFTFIRSDAFLKMIEAYPELRYERYPEYEGDELGIKESYAFWISKVQKLETNQTILITEDYGFCQRALDVGLEIWLDTSIKVGHWKGSKCYMPVWGQLPDEGIQGWLTPMETDWLSRVAKTMESIVEIGSWKGKSTKVLLDNCPGIVYSVDHFKGSPGNITDDMAQEENIFEQFQKNVGHYPNLRVMRMKSEEAANSLNGDRFDMVFIDGNHAYECVKKDIERWLPKTKKMICGHDYPEVHKAVNEVLGHVEQHDSIWWKRVDV